MTSYDIPSAAGGDEGLEGFSVEAAGARVGRLAALNRTPDGLVLLVDSGDAYRPVPASTVAAIDLAGEWVRLAPDGEAALAGAPAVTPRTGFEGPQLVRHIPGELAGLISASGKRRTRSGLWLVAGVLVVLAGFSILPVNLLIEQQVGGALRWLWLAVPLVLLAAAAWAIVAAIGRDSDRELTLREKLADAPAMLLGISPRTRRRG